jgi:hypothetical protein
MQVFTRLRRERNTADSLAVQPKESLMHRKLPGPRATLTLFILPLFVPHAAAQSNSASPASPRESPQDLLTRLLPQQKQQFEEAERLFNGKSYAEALTIYKGLLSELPGDAILSKFVSEAALNVGDVSFALNAIKPVAQADPDDWQASALLTRACAESGDAASRDAGIAHMLDLHRRGITPRGLQQYILERLKVGENMLVVRTSLEPWGPYKVYALGQVIDSQGRIFQRVTLESNDADQPLFAKDYPEEASKGVRRFSLDGYRNTGMNSEGKQTQAHMTYKFFVGQPTYDVIREEFVKVASGKATALGDRTNLVVP